MESVETCDDNFPVNPLPRSGISDYIWSFFAVIIIIAIFVIQEPAKLTHWMLLPLALCGTIVGADAIRWLTGKYAMFDPKGVIGLYGINFFLIAPLLIVVYGREGVETYVITNWPPLLGLMAIFNLVGLVLYKIFEKIAFNRPSKVERTYWSLNAGKATLYVPIFLIIAFLSLFTYVIRSGGWGAMLLQERQGELTTLSNLRGFGVVMILRDALPMATLILLTVFRMTGFYQQKSRTWLFVTVFILILFFITSGLRGSRAATGLGLICAGAILHYFWQRLTVKMVVLSLIPLYLFFYIYGFYKSAGIIGIRELMRGQATIESLQYETKRTFVGMLIGDLSRAPVQAAELDVLVYNKPWPYRYRYGITYLEASVYLVPRQIWPSKPIDTSRIVAGTEMLYGPGTYGELYYGGSKSSQLYGLAGEAMLNFGLFGIPVAFAVWGFIVGKIRKRVYSYRAGDMRLFTSGFWMLIGFVILATDTDQFVWFFTSLYIIPATLVYLISDKVTIDMN
ncbi:MAG: hypothetical protein ABSG82_09980 [Sedimentisphaerales bacterium]